MTRILFAAALALCLGGAAIAQTAPEGPPPDRDGPPRDGPRGEGPRGEAGRGGGFGRLFISPMGEPFRGPDGERRWFDAVDTNHDGVLTREEFRADAMRFFKILDRDGDGQIDGVENQIYENEIVPEITQTGLADEAPRPNGGSDNDGDRPRRGGGGRGGRGGGGGGFPGGGGHGGGDGGGGFLGGPGGGRGGANRLEGAARWSLLNIPQPVRAADSNLDWKVTAQEWIKAADLRFDLLDKDKTGKLTFEGLPPLPGRRPPRESQSRGAGDKSKRAPGM